MIEESALEQRVKQLLQQQSAMLRMGVTPITYVAFKLGCTYENAERLVQRVEWIKSIQEDK